MAIRYRKEKFVAVVGLIIPALLLLYAFISVFAQNINLATVQEESFGYRYFYSLRWMYAPTEFIWLPQGQLVGILHHLYHIILSILGYSPFDQTVFYERSRWFVNISTLGNSLLILAAIYLLLKQLQDIWLSLLLGVLWLFPVLGWFGWTGRLYIYFPDYHPIIVVIVILATGLAARIISKETPPSWKLCVLVGVLGGISIGLKYTLITIPTTLLLLMLLFRHWRKSTLIKIIVIGILVFITVGLVLLGQYLRSIVYLPQIIEALWNFSLSPRGGSAKLHPGGYLNFVVWAWQTGDPVIGLMAVLPLVSLLTVILLRSQTGLKLAIAFLPGCLAYNLMLYVRTAPATTLEVLCFALFTGSILLIKWWPTATYNYKALSYLQYSSIIGVFLFIVLTPSYYYANINKGLLWLKATSQNAELAWQLTNSLSGRSLLLIPDNMHRIQGLETAIFKGGSEIFAPDYNSDLLKQIFPDRDFLSAFGQRAKEIDFNDYDFLLYNYTTDYYLEWIPSQYTQWQYMSFRQIIEDSYGQSIADWRIIRDVPLPQGSRLLVLAKVEVEALPYDSTLTAFYLPYTSSSLKAGDQIPITPERNVSLENNDLILLNSILFKVTANGLVEQTGEQGQKIQIVNLGEWNTESRMYDGLEAVYHFDRWFIDTDQLQPINDNPYLQAGSAANPIAGYQVISTRKAYQVSQLKEDDKSIVRVEALSDDKYLAIGFNFDFQEDAPYTVVAQIRAQTNGDQKLGIFDKSLNEKFHVKQPATQKWITLTIKPEDIHLFADSAINLVILGISDIKQGDWFEIRKFALFPGQLPNLEGFTTLQQPELLKNHPNITAYYLSSSDETIDVGTPITTTITDTHLVEAGDLVLTDQYLLRVEKNKNVPIFGKNQQQIHIKNLGMWDEQHNTFTGVPAIFQEGRWIVDTSSMAPVNPNSSFDQGDKDNPIPNWWISPGDADYEIILMQDEFGGFIRIKTIADAPYLVLTGQIPLNTLDNIPVSIQAQIRASGGRQVLNLFDMIGPENAQSYPVETNRSGDWQTLAINQVIKWPDSNDNYSVGLYDVKAGDWFDIRTFNVYLGNIP